MVLHLDVQDVSSLRADAQGRHTTTKPAKSVWNHYYYCNQMQGDKEWNELMTAVSNTVLSCMNKI